MPRQTGLIRRNGRYYLNFRIPQNLRSFYGKKEMFRESLGTSDYAEAVQEVRHRIYRKEAEFAEKRRLLQQEKISSEKRQLLSLSDREAHEITCKFFIQIEREEESWWQKNGGSLRAQTRAEILENLRFDQTVYNGGGQNYMPEDGSADLDEFLAAENLECEKDSSAYEKLKELFRRARLENIERSVDRLSGYGAKAHQAIFQDVSAHSSPAKKNITLGQLVERHQEALKKSKARRSFPGMSER